MVYEFSNTPMHEIITTLKTAGHAQLSFTVLDPDLGSGHYAGESITIEGRSYPHHSLKAWASLAELLGYRMLLPQPASYPLIRYAIRSFSPSALFIVMP